MVMIWDYDIKKLKKSVSGRRLILERMINYGIFLSDKDKLNLRKVKTNWNYLHLDANRKRFLQFLIWGK
ncbi:hypothetical protein A2Y99_02865 [Candidatus Gottesmanbacteria bacterium RBG_13_37_7]|uniref:Homing endonuclease LAGLIDADG domain-containing protein n=1 Tax=Candidatus Gottesmanbacteria bacterium RBG_13_37_7 TaxID=1798369 RepID=A0A1F5YG70_9BACT|nr:MAG: hypothetical protein A2Y99_02865 [Candidatus Gottesmanbacteria bacterium RBG_13_37_7]